MAIGLVTIADSISNISVSGLTIKDIDQIPQVITQRDCPMLMPDPDNYIGFSIAPDVLSKTKWTIHYKLNYILVHSVVGAGRTTVLDNYSAMITKVMAVIDAVIGLTSLTGAVDWDATAGDPFILDWNNTQYNACRIVINAVEFID